MIIKRLFRYLADRFSRETVDESVRMRRQLRLLLEEGRAGEALTMALSGWPPECGGWCTPERLLATAYLAGDEHWVRVAVQVLAADHDRDWVIAAGAAELTPEELEKPFESWRFHRLAAHALSSYDELELRAIKRACELHPTSELYYETALTRTDPIQKDAAERKRALTEAVDLLYKALSLDAGNMRARHSLTTRLLEMGRTEEAESVIEQGNVMLFVGRSDWDTQNSRASYLATMADVKHALGKDEEALAAFYKALEIYPDYFNQHPHDMPLESYLLYEKLRKKQGRK